jgi:UDP-glucuronate 4-epimerase
MTYPPQVIITGAAGFIGYHLAQKVLSNNIKVIGIDNLNDYYDVSLKKARLTELEKNTGFSFYQIDLANKESVDELFKGSPSAYVVHLAAQAGVRYSLTHPYAYLEANLRAFLNILEACRAATAQHLIYASSSSVYGGNTKMPFSIHDNVDHPISLYAATKKANELLAHTYSALYKLPTTGLRFFTVYGPYGRPDMAMFLFTKAILEGKPIQVFNYGKMKRDFTYVDDIVESIFRLIPKIATPNPSWTGDAPDPGTSFAPYRVYNIGNNNPVELMTLISVLEQKLNRNAIKDFLPLQTGDVPETYADVDDLMNDVGFKPSTSIEDGVSKFVDWYLDYYKNRT